jgi:uncharacterized Zn-finger protein
MGPVDTIKVKERKIFCEGDSRSSLGHPRVYLDIGYTNDVDCPYCGRRYILEEDESKDD